jgi:hypothetical protein
MTGAQGIVRLDDGKVYEGLYAIEGAWVTVSGRERRRGNGGFLYSQHGKWIWPARRVESIKAFEPERLA